MRIHGTVARLVAIGIAVLGLGVCATAMAEESAPPPLAGLRGEMIAEPVFGGDMLVYTGGNPQGPTLVLVHGIGPEASGIWAGVIGELRDDYHIVAFDLPGFGRSDKGNHLYSPGRYSELLKFVIDRYSDEPVLLLGHSMGGAIALKYTDTYPDTVARLYLASVPAILHRAAYTQFLVTLGIPVVGNDNPLDRFANKMMRKVFRKSPPLEQALEWPSARQQAFDGDPQKIAGFALVSENFSTTVWQLRAPTTLIWGGDDEVAPLRTGYLLGKRLANAELVVMPGLGHAPMLGDPAGFNHLLRQRLASGPQPPPTEADTSQSQGEGRCEGEHDVRFSGHYSRLRIENCRNVLLDGVHASRVEIVNSTVEIRFSELHAADTPLDIFDSEVSITASDITGRRAIHMSSTYLDVAGSLLRGEEAAVSAYGRDANEIIFSVSRVDTGGNHRYLHDIRALPSGETL